MNLTKFVDGLKELPSVCGWQGAYVKVEPADKPNEVYVSCDIFHEKVEPDYIYTSFWGIINQARHIFGNNLIDSEIMENPDKDDASQYTLMLTIKYKNNTSNQKVIDGE